MVPLDFDQVATELQAVSILSSKNLSRTLRFLSSSSIEVLLLEDFIDVEDVGDFKGDASGSEKEKNVENRNEATKNVKEWEDERYKEDDDEDEEGPLFALYCGGETSVIAGLGQENGYYQVGRADLI